MKCADWGGARGRGHPYLSNELHSKLLKGGYIGDRIGEHYRAY